MATEHTDKSTLDKILGIAIWVLIIVVAILLLLWVFVPTFKGNSLETYVRLVLIMLGLCTFALLRIYNAIVGNTRFLIKLRETMGQLKNALPALEREIRTATSSLNSHRAGNESLRKVTTTLGDKIGDLTERVKESTTQVRNIRSKN